jgi:hypothetical protein
MALISTQGITDSGSSPTAAKHSHPLRRPAGSDAPIVTTAVAGFLHFLYRQFFIYLAQISRSA